VDDFYNSIFRTLLTFMMENSHNITAATHLLFIAKNLSGSATTHQRRRNGLFRAHRAAYGDRVRGDDPTRPARRR
jgi:phosphate transport system protein